MRRTLSVAMGFILTVQQHSLQFVLCRADKFLAELKQWIIYIFENDSL